MLNKKIEEALNGQANKEIYSGYFYLGMSAYAASLGLPGFQHWFYQQWKEELFHAKKFYDYIVEEKGKVALEAIEKPPQYFTSATDLFAKTLNHEKKVTGLINDLVTLAKSQNDQKTCDFLQWFVKEQAEEEEGPAKILKKIEEKGKDEKGLSEIDTELATRK
jgi:ferritin